jgi:hypothetical protein
LKIANNPIPTETATKGREMAKIKIYSKETLSNAIGVLRQAFKDKGYLTMSISTGKARSLSQNALSHAWYTQVAVEEGEYTDGEVKRLCKFHFGLPILRGEDEHFNEVCCQTIDPLPYESKIAAMEYLPVTSLMKTKQLARYLEAVQAHYVGRVELLFPED